MPHPVHPSLCACWAAAVVSPLSPLQKHPVRRQQLERRLVQFQCQIFVASWTGVIQYHGPRPVARQNRVWVCNHTSMIDYIILTAYSPFCVIMQLHPGWVGFLQTQVLNCLGCLWFNRTEVSLCTPEQAQNRLLDTPMLRRSGVACCVKYFRRVGLNRLHGSSPSGGPGPQLPRLPLVHPHRG